MLVIVVVYDALHLGVVVLVTTTGPAPPWRPPTG
jgi:hypothetical protein